MVLIMKNSKLTILAFFLTGLLSHDILGQLNRLQYADRQYELNNFRLAAKEYEKIYSIKKNYSSAKKAAQSLDMIHEYSESYLWWKKAVNFSQATKQDFASLLRAGFRSNQNYNPTADLIGSSFNLGDFEEFTRLENMSHLPYREYELKLIEDLNSAYSDYGLSENNAGNRFFASNREEIGSKKKLGINLDMIGSNIGKNYYKSDGKNYYGLYSKENNGGLYKIKIEGYDGYHLSDPRLLSNGKMVFTATPNWINNSGKVIYPGLFYGTYDSESHLLKDIKAFPYNQTSSYSVIVAGVDEENKRLYFSSDRPGGFGGHDLYYVTWDKDMKFSKPVNLGTSINSPYNERDAFRIGTEFYFSSNRKGGFGGLDVYLAQVKEDTFDSVINLGHPINSKADDFGFIRDIEARAYLSSDRIGGKGYDDLYQVEWTDRIIKVSVVDTLGNSLEEGTRIHLIDGLKSTEITNIDQNVLVEMTKKGSSYTFLAIRPSYFNQEITTTIINDQEDVILVMVPIPYELEVFRELIYFDLDKDFLRELSMEKLDDVAAWMLRYPETNLLIESHTDSRASDSYNQQLSERRAASVTKYLKEKGIDATRVKSEWFSETKLINDCGDGVPCPESNHQLNRRSELKIIAFPDRNINYRLPNGAIITDFRSAESAKNWFLRNFK